MERCGNCSNDASCGCTPCKTAVYQEHKALHQKGDFGKHSFEDLLVQLTPKQISRVIGDLSVKIKVARDCEKRIIEETQKILAHTKSLCRKTLKSINEQKHIYFNLLKICKQQLNHQQREIIQRELRRNLSIKVPIYRFKDIDQFYSCNFLNRFEKISQINSMDIVNAKLILEEDYGLYLQAHTESVSAVAVTNDNKYIVSGSNDNTIRVWNLKKKRQEFSLHGHTDGVRSITITSDNRYIVSYSRDLTIRVWSFQDRNQKTLFQGHTAMIQSLAITSDSKQIV